MDEQQNRPVQEERAERTTQGLAPAPIQEPNKIRQINVEEVSRGYIVRVGCQTFAIGTKAELIANLSAYIQEPALTEKKWFDGKLF